MDKLCKIFTVSLLLVQVLAAQNTELSQKDFLRELYDLSSLPAYVSFSRSAEVSTYDRTGGNNDGFAGTYSFIRRNEDSSLVLFDIKGAGVINRIWTPTPSDDSLDFYIDDGSAPAFTICYRDLFSGKVYPFVAPLCANQLGGYYCYLPIPFNQSCKIIFRGKTTRFHQIGYRLYPEGTRIRKFQLPLPGEEQEALAKIKSVWDRTSLTVKELSGEGPSLSPVVKRVALNSGQRVTVFETRQPGRIIGFELIASAGLEKSAKDIDLKITWDDDKVPALYCPLADYFGYAFGKPSMKSLLVGSDGERNYSWFPMPFDQSARIELMFRKPASGNKESTINLLCKIYYSPRKRNIAKEGRFYASWNRENPVPVHQPYPILNIKGKGHFVGTALQAQGLNAGMTTFFEGDDSTVVDGELRMHGTGSEDFFNGGWYALLDCWDAAMSLPLSGALEYSIPLCRTGGYRLFVSDKISFEKSFFHSIEHGPERNEVPSDYTSVSYYYCSQSNAPALLPSAENTRPYQPDTLLLFPQLMNAGFDGDIGIKTRWAFPTNGLTFYYTVTANSILRMSMRDIPPGSYRLYLDYVKSPEASRFSVWQRQTMLTDWIEGWDKNTERVAMQPVADLVLTALNNTVSFRFKTTAERNQFILNRILLVKKKE